jgi:hypothetical protein
MASQPMLLLAILLASVTAPAACSPINREAQDEWLELRADCRIHRGDENIVLAECAPGRGSYYFTETHVRDRKTRITYNQVLYGLLRGGFYRVDYGEGISRFDHGLLQVLLPTREEKKEFLQALYSVRDSSVWADGHGFAVYDILALEVFQPDGIKMANRAISEHASSCNTVRIGKLQLADLVLFATSDMEETFDAIGRCPANDKNVGLSLLSAVGLARIGKVEKGNEVLARLSEMARENVELQNTIRRIRHGLEKLPEGETALREVLTEWLDLPM